MFVYLDNSATTKTFDIVNEEMSKMLSDCYGNPSSLHRFGMLAEEKIDYSREILAKSLGCKKNTLTFTSGGTESNNLAIIGYALRNRKKGNKIITDSIEHPSVFNAFKFLEQSGFLVSIINVFKDGSLDYEMLENEIDDNTVLVSIMHVNNETGSVFDIKRIKEIISKKNKNTVLHCDCVQSYLKIPFSVNSLSADMVSVSSHKINGPKGIGAVYIKEGLQVSPLLYGGGQEKNLRSGTENTVGIYGFGVAINEHLKYNEKDIIKINGLRKKLMDGISDIDNVIINTCFESSAPHILNVSFLGIRSEILLHTLEQYDLFVSSGSACSTNDSKKKKVLESMGYEKDIFDSAIRFSLSVLNNEDEIDYAVDIIKREVSILRKRLRI